MKINGKKSWKLESCGRDLDLCVQVMINQYLFLQGIQLISQALYPHTGLLQLLPGCAYCLVIHFWGHLGIIQLEETDFVWERILRTSSSSMQLNWGLLSSRTASIQEKQNKFDDIFPLEDYVWELECLKTKEKIIRLLPWPGRFVLVLPYKERLAHHVASLNPGEITQTW